MAKSTDNNRGKSTKNNAGNKNEENYIKLPDSRNIERFNPLSGIDEMRQNMELNTDFIEKEDAESKAKGKEDDTKEKDKQKNANSDIQKQYFFVYDKGKLEKKGYPEFGVAIGNAKSLDEIPEKLTKFYTMAEETNTVIEVLYSKDRVKPKKNETVKQAVERIAESRDKYISKLISISEVGLNDAQPSLATNSLKKMQQEIIIREGGKIKNRYFSRLGVYALIIALLIGSLGMFFRSLNTKPVFVPEEAEVEIVEEETEEVKAVNEEKSGMFDDNIVYVYLFVFAGSAIGTWISFGFRKRKLSFMDLVVLEEDRIKAFPRLLFAGVVSLVLLLFLSSGLFNFSIGNIEMTEIAEKVNVEYQLLIGVIAGLLGDSLVEGIYNTANNIVDFDEKKS